MPLRPSTELRVITFGNQFARFVAGMLIFATSAYFEMLEYKEATTHSGHIYLWGSGMFLGLLVAFGAYIFPVLTRLIVVIGPYIPGGRRITDKITDELHLPPPPA